MTVSTLFLLYQRRSLLKNVFLWQAFGYWTLYFGTCIYTTSQPWFYICIPWCYYDFSL
ncbi:hypothetical protein BS47DRAFT_1338908 [Hydnum rufescens UP504]|uniref:Uncharacterized protein n=1 Tax=Hydnum rufescens UP504 TaxID=1448309 RepID=A0A9P6DX11_9AGAM|nr:hypothetical protein BS47DRAFT_1338908 [Hydnum rufescens UP504]